MWCGRLPPTAMVWWMINGVGFRYSFSALKDRHTAVEVNYTDPQKRLADLHGTGGRPEAILRYGRNLLKMDAFGCTSRGQAPPWPGCG